MKYVGIEAGGTKFVLGVYGEHAKLEHRTRLDTRDPQTTLAEVCDYIQHHQPDAVGIASFGPLDLNPDSPTYGNITSTPKPGWANTALLKTLQSVFKGPMGLDTDVNGAALAESLWGAGQGAHSLVYLTVGTGIGAGIMIESQTVHGLLHPEFGHITLRSHPDDAFKGVCPYHQHCFEGLASGPALFARTQRAAETLSPNDPVWEYEVYYLAQACATLALTLAPERIILGGGVMHQEHLLPRVRTAFKAQLNGYLQVPAMIEGDDYICAPGLADDAGLLGAIALAQRAAHI